ncbi:hypothetical protein [Streptomyces werraensis]|uniref:hypothetical protein n=1 Tax=Streptomyces werraensis TaxID=68284 RepID=UPI00380270B2
MTVARAPQPPTPWAPAAGATAPGTFVPEESAEESSGEPPTQEPAPFRTDDDVTEALARLDAPLSRWTATGLRDDLFIQGSDTESHQRAAAIERLRQLSRPRMRELRAALGAVDAIPGD